MIPDGMLTDVSRRPSLEPRSRDSRRTPISARMRVGLCNIFDDEVQEPLLLGSALKIRSEVAEVGRRLGADEPVEHDEQVSGQESGDDVN